MFRSYHTGRPAIALTIALGLMLQSLMPAFFATTGFAAVGEDRDGLATIIICSDEGFVRITLDEAGNLLETEKSATGNPAKLTGKTACPCCVLPGCEGIGPITQTSFCGSHIAADPSFSATNDKTTAVPANLIQRARAPPKQFPDIDHFARLLERFDTPVQLQSTVSETLFRHVSRLPQSTRRI